MPRTIRPATPADLAVVVEFNRRLGEETEGKALDLDVLRPGVRAALADPAGKGPYFVADEDGVVVGQLGVTTEWSDWRNGWFWWIQSVYVLPERRGQKVFRELFEHVRQTARANPEVIGLRLYVDEDNHAAQGIYRHLGLVKTDYHLMELYPLA